MSRKSILYFFVIILVVSSCTKEKREAKISETEITISNITANSAKATGEIVDLGQGIDDYGHCWSTSVNPTLSGPRTSLGKAGRTGIFNSDITALTPNTLYYVRAYIKSGGDILYSSEASFTTSCNSAASTTNGATTITATSAILNGTVNANGSSTAVTFEYGTTSSYGNSITATPGTVTGSSNTSVSAGLSGLVTNTTYHFRVKTVNCGNTSFGFDQTFTTFAVTDFDGNNYTSVIIGTQIWMAQNLKTTKYNDGTSISLITDNTDWIIARSAYCWYNNDALSYKNNYGALYTWYAVDSTANGHKNVCPVGWHVPDNTEWMTLVTFLGGIDVAGGKLKEIGTVDWLSPNTGADNTTGFTALPSGRRNSDGTFQGIGSSCGWWGSTYHPTDEASVWNVFYNFNDVSCFSFYGIGGYSIRCLKD